MLGASYHQAAKAVIELLAIGCVAITVTGCSTMVGDQNRGPIKGMDTSLLEAQGYTFDEKGAQRPLPPSDGTPSVIMEVRNGKKHLERIPLRPDKPTFVQDIVDDAKLVSRLGKIHVSILRSKGPNLPPTRLDCDFDPETRRIAIGQDYALQPNDQLIVTKDTTSWLDRIGIFSR